VSQELWWYTVRATGLVAWFVVTVAVVWGLLLSLRQIPATRRSSLPRPAWMLDLHRFLGGLAVLLVVAHVGALAFDAFVGFDWNDLLVPFASAWRPAAIAWGIVAAYLLVAIEVSSLLMRHMRRGLWHAVHLLSFVVFGAITAHALYAGADAHEPLVQGFAVGSTVVVVLLVLVRIVWRPRTARPAPQPAAALQSLRR
jgi:methionine sulfoxide reductase heme-binding subunit